MEIKDNLCENKKTESNIKALIKYNSKVFFNQIVSSKYREMKSDTIG